MQRLFEIMRFLAAGSIGVMLYYTLLYALTDLAGVWYMLSAVIASVVNWTSNFILQKFWTFGDRGTQGMHRQAGQYSFLAGGLFAGNLALLYLLVEYARLWYLGAQVIVTMILTVISYFVSRRIFATATACVTAVTNEDP